MKYEERRCLSCGHILYGRADKKFCNDSCRNTWNNRVRHRATSAVYMVNTILKRNRNLLQDALPNGTSTARIRKIQLEAQGFNPGFFTGASKRRNGSLVFLCYEFGFSIAGECYNVMKRRRAV